MVDVAEVPIEPVRPRVVLNLAISLIVGLGLVVGIAFFQEHLDNTLKTPEEVQRFLGVPAIGIIPAANRNGKAKLPYGYGYGYGSQKSLAQGGDGGNENQDQRDLIGAQGNSQLMEAYRSLRTSVLLSTSQFAWYRRWKKSSALAYIILL